MNIVDWIGSIGVTVMLIAFLLNLTKKITQDSLLYTSFNLIGGLTACTASILLHYFPFIILEAIWSLVSLIAVINWLRKRYGA